MADLTLYTNPMSRGRIARWALEEIGADYDVKVIAYGPDMKGPDYLAINPMGKVPALKHGDTIVTECAAICAYLADAFPAAAIAPVLSNRGDYYRWMFFAAGPLEAAVANRNLGFEVPSDKEGMVGYGSYTLVLNALEQVVSKSQYIAGDQFTAADIYIGAHLMWGMQFNSIERRPAFEAYVKNLVNRAAYKRANELDDALAAQTQKAS
ncbi:glutathione S-transferase family protein [Rhizobium sp. FKY42]|uniref:glutathione S-transferase family protein n=1 Tax=Rhizobium sp. FKY42 TaxID=2562310 RepID=UPI0010C05ADB|nr:glutathione S-transferase family protein [Rhizobium sp. FKY42]